MSDGKISLQFLGEQMLRMQADFRGVRSEQVKLESELATTQAEIAGLRSDVSRMASGQVVMQAEITDLRLEVSSVDGKVDNLAASVDAQFRQVRETMATNLEIVLNALDARTGRSDRTE
jgi:predicted  nucleic acid-binding Zn-ribbon protein